MIPSVITLLPLLWTVYFLCREGVTDPFLFAGSGGIALALVYLCGMILKDMGTGYANRFWAKAEGAPSTRMGRMRDSYLSIEQKHRIHSTVRAQFSIELLSLIEELEYPELADRRIVDAFREVKACLRHSGHATLVDKHNAEYGATRNLRREGTACQLRHNRFGGVRVQRRDLANDKCWIARESMHCFALDTTRMVGFAGDVAHEWEPLRRKRMDEVSGPGTAGREKAERFAARYDHGSRENGQILRNPKGSL